MKAYLITMICLGAIGLVSDPNKPTDYPGAVKLLQVCLLAWTIYLLVEL